MRKFAALTVAVMALVAGCGDNQNNPMTSTGAEFAPQPAAKPGDAGTEDCGHETAYGGFTAVNVGSGGSWFYYSAYSLNELAGSGVTTPMTAGQHNAAGNVSFSFDGASLTIQYATATGWQFNDPAETHVGIYTDLTSLYHPNGRGGRLAPGTMNFYPGSEFTTDNLTYVIPVSVLASALGPIDADQTLYILTHGVVYSAAQWECAGGDGCGGGGDDEFDACDTNEDGAVDTDEAEACNPTIPTYSTTGNVSWADVNSTDIEGLVVELLDAAGDVIATATTDADGNYSFNDLPDGDYTVQVAAGQIAQDGTGPQAVIIDGADGVADFAFELATISGDLSWANDRSTAIAAIVVELLDGDGNVIATATTDADGNYTFTVLPGDYTVGVTDGQIAQDYNGAQSVSIGADSNCASVENVDFVAQLPTISGNVYFDITGDLLLSSDEPGVEGVTMTLSDGQTVVTDANGNYTFTVLPGDYTVSVGDVQGMDLMTTTSLDVSINADTQYTSVAGVDSGLALNIEDFCGQLADGFTIGFWKNNVSKAIAGRTKGVQVDAATIDTYVDMVADYALEPFDGIDAQGAVDVLSSKSSDAADLLAKQLLGSEFNLMNGAYIGGNELVTEMFIHYGEYLLKHADDYSRGELLDAKDWYDAYNNSHGGAIAGPDCQ